MSRMRLAVLCFVMMTLANAAGYGQVAPTNGTKPAEITTKRLIVNGRPVPSTVVKVDNRLYVSLEDISSASNGAVTLSGNDVIVSFSSEQPLPASAVQSRNGGIRGTLTYFFNFNYGNRPDTGAEIALVSGTVNVPSTVHMFILGSMVSIDKKSIEAVKITAADGSGNYALADVAPGEYTLLLKSNHAKAVTSRDVMGKVLTVPVTIKPDETIDISRDFGMNEAPI